MNRKTFIRKTSVGLLLGIPAVSLLSCSGSDDSGPGPGTDDNMGTDDDIGSDPDGDCVENGTNSSISANHGHSLTVSKEDVAAGNEKTYTLSQASTDQHIHEVTISASQFESLRANDQITASSSSNAGHSHSVTVSCA